MSGENTETIHLINIERQNTGEYSCSAKNEIGENYSSTITLRVQCKLFIVIFFYSLIPENLYCK